MTEVTIHSDDIPELAAALQGQLFTPAQVDGVVVDRADTTVKVQARALDGVVRPMRLGERVYLLIEGHVDAVDGKLVDSEDRGEHLERTVKVKPDGGWLLTPEVVKGAGVSLVDLVDCAQAGASRDADVIDGREALPFDRYRRPRG